MFKRRNENVIDDLKSDLNKRLEHHNSEIERLTEIIDNATRLLSEHVQVRTALYDVLSNFIVYPTENELLAGIGKDDAFALEFAKVT
ncbi:hypothetical protein P106B_69 [Rhizobium phage vB_RglS_P106B]|uniref:Uncharacterized protein n=1 Tax=Rhizobium phage vB_RglS_P106B TaxID=1458697 RepID=W6EC40_9CAUD|nr:hypothetical protein P106B_69 [Rhizobium phage vB_RglS_P106B]AHJ10752.1 hypothetical protein P106B_69 [Rhizobium phage vB_RglS_P106B]